MRVGPDRWPDVKLWERVVQANRPGPPEDSVRFRTASTLAVMVAIAACWSQGELSAPLALFTMAATAVGNALSYWRRARPWMAVKPILAFCVVGGFLWFLVTVTRTATPGNIATVEQPLAALFAWVLSTHAFDVPARRDVAYSLAGSAALMAVAAAQTVDLSLAPYVVVWAACGVWGLVAMWQSMSGARGVPWASLGFSSAVVAVLAVLFVALLPAPHVSTALIFPSSSAGDSPVNSPSNLTDGGGASLPAHAAAPDGPTRVGGYLGFAKSLDTAVRGHLGNQVILRVRASKPSFWIGQTYDTWNGQSWVESSHPTNGPTLHKLTSGSPFTIPLSPDQLAPLAGNASDIQTFYLAQSGPNLVFHADNAQRVYLQSQQLFLTGSGTIVSSTSMGAGTVYTVVSADNVATPAQLRASTTPPARGGSTPSLTPAQKKRYLQLPSVDPRVAALATRITAGITTSANGNPRVYDKIAAIEAWMSSHIHYSTDIPPLRPGQNAVDSFLFGSRIGYCEQISTATAVMLRSIGIPAREAVGYVPGSFNPITDLYQVQAKDAHAWVQVWFPGYGWQNFDPTAQVPLANPSPGSVIARSTAKFFGHLPWVPITVVVVVAVAAVDLRRRYLRRPKHWADQVARGLERAGQQAGLARGGNETLARYCERLARAAPELGPDLHRAATAVEGSAYGGGQPDPPQAEAIRAFARQLRIPRNGHGHRKGRNTGRAGTRQDDASASANDAPAASRGR